MLLRRSAPQRIAAMASAAPARRSGGALAVAAGIFLSRIVGLVRERAINHYLGLSSAADAFRAMQGNVLGETALRGTYSLNPSAG